jgi:alpha-ketoglutarate-dependent taurine dioxygenase
MPLFWPSSTSTTGARRVTEARTRPLTDAGFGMVVDGPLSPDAAAGLRGLVDRSGAVLVRRSGVSSVEDLHRRVEGTLGGLLPYDDASTPRTEVAPGVHTATEFPAELAIPPHNEQAYSSHAPRYLAFFCDRPADAGGSTHLVDSNRWHEEIPASTRARFDTGGVTYVRNYYPWLAPNWQTAFRTDDPDVALQRCRADGGEASWRPDGLRTLHRRTATICHPETGDTVWFNQAHLFHPARLDDDTRVALRDLYEPDALPRDARYGDGEPIPDDEIGEVLAAAQRCTVDVDLEAGDLLVLDNLRVAHGRLPFRGTRRMYVTMTGRWKVPTDG